MNFLFGIILGGVFGYIISALIFVSSENREVKQLRKHIEALKKEIEYWQTKRSEKK